MTGAGSSALLTDRYELTMLDAALRAGRADLPAAFEVFSRRLPAGRPAGVFAGVGRLVDALERFRFGPEELAWLEDAGFLSPETLSVLSELRFSGSIDAYLEGEWYTAGSPVLTVCGTFGEAVLLETLVLSILNFDSAVASAASVLVAAAGGRPIIEMGSRRTDPEAAVAAARAAYLGGFASTSNLEAGRRYHVPTAGTAAHSFVLAFPDEREAFAAQVAAMGPGTTLLVDTFELETGVRRAVEVAGPQLGGIRIDSGDLAAGARRARTLLDDLGAPGAAVVVTGDLDDRAIRSLAGAPVDAYGVGTSVEPVSARRAPAWCTSSCPSAPATGGPRARSPSSPPARPRSAAASRRGGWRRAARRSTISSGRPAPRRRSGGAPWCSGWSKAVPRSGSEPWRRPAPGTPRYAPRSLQGLFSASSAPEQKSVENVPFPLPVGSRATRPLAWLLDARQPPPARAFE